MSLTGETLADRRSFIRGFALVASVLAGCAGRTSDADDAPSDEPEVQEEPAVEEEPTVEELPTPDEAPTNTDEEDDPMDFTITINGVPFAAKADEGQAGQDLLARLPFSLHMEELHGNEKYCYTGEGFGGQASVPDTIYAGDLMVYDDDCLVLFYETHPNDGGWAYKLAARITDTSALEETCGKNSVMVDFSR